MVKFLEWKTAMKESKGGSQKVGSTTKKVNASIHHLAEKISGINFLVEKAYCAPLSV